jgi:hypothetical protein
MSFITHEKHVENLLKTKQTHDAKKAMLQTWEAWRQGKFVDDNGKEVPFVYKGKVKIREDLEYERDLTRRVRNLFVRLENMKPIGELEDE